VVGDPRERRLHAVRRIADRDERPEHDPHVEPRGERPPRRLDRLFAQGVVVNVLNPKTALFFFAFLPQFVDVDAGSVGLQILALGLIFIGIAVVSDGMYALAAGTASGWLRGNPRFLRAERWISGTVLVGLGVTAALSGSNRAK